ncbi:MAG: hypothetical protein JW765_01905 [Deltaproteobacteria bacterium]|nr:hypothetical protein [Candidatus Zymogenaceae bacterium]
MRYTIHNGRLMWCLTDAEKRVIVGALDRSRRIAKKTEKRSIAMAWRETKKKKGIKDKGNVKTSGIAGSIAGVLSASGSASAQAPDKKKTTKKK